MLRCTEKFDLLRLASKQQSKGSSHDWLKSTQRSIARTEHG